MPKTNHPSLKDQIESLGDAVVLLALKVGELQERLRKMEEVYLCVDIERGRPDCGAGFGQ